MNNDISEKNKQENNPQNITCVFDKNEELLEDKILKIFDNYLYENFNKM